MKLPQDFNSVKDLNAQPDSHNGDEKNILQIAATKNDKIESLFILIAFIGFCAFFFKWFDFGFLGSTNGFEIFSKGYKADIIFLPLLFIPIGFLASAILRSSIFNTTSKKTSLIIDLIPLAVIVFYLVYSLFKLGFDIEKIDVIPFDLITDFNIISLGFYLTFIASVILPFASVIKASLIKFTKD